MGGSSSWQFFFPFANERIHAAVEGYFADFRCHALCPNCDRNRPNICIERHVTSRSTTRANSSHSHKFVAEARWRCAHALTHTLGVHLHSIVMMRRFLLWHGGLYRIVVFQGAIVSAYAHVRAIPLHEFVDTRSRRVCCRTTSSRQTNGVEDRGAPYQ